MEEITKAKKDDFPLFGNSPFIDLLILEEFESEQMKDETLLKIENLLKSMFAKKAQLTDYYEYGVIHKNAKDPELHVSVILELVVHDLEQKEEDSSALTFEEYMEQVVFAVTDEMDEGGPQLEFEMSPNGLLEALQCFNGMVAKHV